MKHLYKMIAIIASYAALAVTIVILIVSLINTTVTNTKTAYEFNAQNEMLQEELNDTKKELAEIKSELSQAKSELSQAKSELSTTKSELSTTKSTLNRVEANLTTQKNLAESYKSQAEYWKDKYNASNSDNDTYTYSFNNVNDLLSAIKTNPYEYNNKEVQVEGTLAKCDAILALVDINEPLDSRGVMLRSQLKNNPNINIKIPDDLLYTIANHNDYMQISGTVKIANGEIYLNNCTYTP